MKEIIQFLSSLIGYLLRNTSQSQWDVLSQEASDIVSIHSHLTGQANRLIGTGSSRSVALSVQKFNRQLTSLEEREQKLRLQLFVQIQKINEKSSRFASFHTEVLMQYLDLAQSSLMQFDVTDLEVQTRDQRDGWRNLLKQTGLVLKEGVKKGIHEFVLEVQGLSVEVDKLEGKEEHLRTSIQRQFLSMSAYCRTRKNTSQIASDWQGLVDKIATAAVTSVVEVVEITTEIERLLEKESRLAKRRQLDINALMQRLVNVGDVFQNGKDTSTNSSNDGAIVVESDY